MLCSDRTALLMPVDIPTPDGQTIEMGSYVAMVVGGLAAVGAAVNRIKGLLDDAPKVVGAARKVALWLWYRASIGGMMHRRQEADIAEIRSSLDSVAAIVSRLQSEWDATDPASPPADEDEPTPHQRLVALLAEALSESGRPHG